MTDSKPSQQNMSNARRKLCTFALFSMRWPYKQNSLNQCNSLKGHNLWKTIPLLLSALCSIVYKNRKTICLINLEYYTVLFIFHWNMSSRGLDFLYVADCDCVWHLWFKRNRQKMNKYGNVKTLHQSLKKHKHYHFCGVLLSG